MNVMNSGGLCGALRATAMLMLLPSYTALSDTFKQDVSKELYNFKSLYKFIQTTCRVF
jgi:hypothetical protein